jgi:hypothetical protein
MPQGGLVINQIYIKLTYALDVFFLMYFFGSHPRALVGRPRVWARGLYAPRTGRGEWITSPALLCLSSSAISGVCLTLWVDDVGVQ